MQWLAEPLNRLHEDLTWFVRAQEIRLMLLRNDADFRGPLLEALPKLEFHADNRSAWTLLADAHTRANDGWQLRSNNLAANWSRRVEAFAADGLSLTSVDAELASSGLLAFGRTAAAVSAAVAAPLEGIVIVLAPSVVEDAALLEAELTWLMQQRGDYRVGAIIDTESGACEFEHDTAGRLLGWHRPGELGERRFIDPGGRVFRTPDHADRDYGPGQRLDRDADARFEYDDDGQRIARTNSDGVQRLHYDGRGWLREVETVDGTRVSFEYDVFGRRVSKQVVDPDGTLCARTDWVWDGEQIVHELRADAAPITWVHEPERWTPVAKLQGEQAISIVGDLSGAPVELFDAKGQRRWRMLIDPFGVATIEGRADECPWRWPGQYADEETGLYYNRHRYYDPKTGLYLSPDPLGLAAGSRIWSYVDDPLTWIDPLGLCDFIALFRGTSQGYPGNPGVQLARRTPTSTNPAIATIFATQSQQHGDGVLHILTHSDLTGIRTGPGNVLAHLEAEVVLHALPRQVRNRATVTITADAARQILADMGIRVPAAIHDVAALDRAVRNAPHMSNNQIRRFLQRAREQNTNPKCFR